MGVLLAAGPGPVSAVVHGASLPEVLAQAERVTPVTVVGVDMPLGLPRDGLREADRLARAALGRKAGSVFTTAVREAYLAATHAEATAVNAARTGKGLSVQGWHLGRKVLELDGWAPRCGRVVIEVHPELSFARMAGSPVLAGKRTREGALRRQELLSAEGLWPLPAGPPRGLAALDDLLDAAAVAWSARRYAEGRAVSLPSPPEAVADGVPAAIWS